MIIISERREDGLKMSLMSFDLVYFIQLKRIAFGFSQEELSFLIGRESGFIADREAFKSDCDLWMNDISIMSKIFDCTISEFFRTVKGELNQVKVMAQQVTSHDKIHHETFCLNPDGSSELLYKVNEMDPEKLYTAQQAAELLLISRKEIAALMEEGYFTTLSKCPFEVFLACRKRAGFVIKAKFIAHALNEYVEDGGQRFLKKYKVKGKGFVYEEALLV